MLIGTSTHLALHAQRSIFDAQQEIKSSSEKMSSGIRINRAADDAAGLSIADGMYSQVVSNMAASRNANGAISTAQIADGGIEELTSMVQRLRELAVQAASDTYNTSNRTSFQVEANQLLTEISSITDSTQMNSSKLLDGTFNSDFVIGADGQTANLAIKGLDAIDLGLVDDTADIIKAEFSNFSNTEVS